MKSTIFAILGALLLPPVAAPAQETMTVEEYNATIERMQESTARIKRILEKKKETLHELESRVNRYQSTYEENAPAAQHPDQVFVRYKDLHRICRSGTRQTASVPHPFLPGQSVEIQFYGPQRRPYVRQWPNLVVYDYGCHRVRFEYVGQSIVVNYDGPSRYPVFHAGIDWQLQF